MTGSGTRRRGENRAKPINLALQGGGAHGAFTWGVLDRLLEDDRVAFEGLSGTSAGAMNAAVFAQGYHVGGREGARRSLSEFWHAMSRYSWLSPVHRSYFDRLTENWNTDRSPSFLAFETLWSMFSPYQLNPLDFDPLRDLLTKTIDFPALKMCDGLKLYVSATNVRTGKIRVFEQSELSIDVLMASACLPLLYKAVMIEGDPYWDGGYRGNPALFPMFYNCGSRDIVIVQINPLTRDGVPKTAAEIVNRLNEITFNGALMAEMRAVAFVARLIETGSLTGPEADRLKQLHVHMISADEAMRELGFSSKYNTEIDFLLFLKELGRSTAGDWLDAHYDQIEKESTIPIRDVFL